MNPANPAGQFDLIDLSNPSNPSSQSNRSNLSNFVNPSNTITANIEIPPSLIPGSVSKDPKKDSLLPGKISSPNPPVLPDLKIIPGLAPLPIPKEEVKVPRLNLEKTVLNKASPQKFNVESPNKVNPKIISEGSEKGLKFGEDKGNKLLISGTQGGTGLNEKRDAKLENTLEEDGELPGGLNVNKGNEGNSINNPQLIPGVLQKSPPVNVPGMRSDPILKNISYTPESISRYTDSQEDNLSIPLINDTASGIFDYEQSNLLNSRSSVEREPMPSPASKLPPMGPPIIPIDPKSKPENAFPLPQGPLKIPDKPFKPSNFPVFTEQGPAKPAPNIPNFPVNQKISNLPNSQNIPNIPTIPNIPNIKQGPPKNSDPVIENKTPNPADNERISKNAVPKEALNNPQTGKNLPSGLLPNFNPSNPQSTFNPQSKPNPGPPVPISQALPPFPLSNQKLPNLPVPQTPNLPVPQTPNLPVPPSLNPNNLGPSSYLPSFPGLKPLPANPLPIPDDSNNKQSIDINYKLIKPKEFENPLFKNDPKKQIPEKSTEDKPMFKPYKYKKEGKIIQSDSSSGNSSESSSSSSEEEEKKDNKAKVIDDNEKKRLNFIKEGQSVMSGGLAKSYQDVSKHEEVLPAPELVSTHAVKVEEPFCFDCIDAQDRGSILTFSCGCSLCYGCIVMSSQIKTCKSCQVRLKNEDFNKLRELLGL